MGTTDIPKDLVGFNMYEINDGLIRCMQPEVEDLTQEEWSQWHEGDLVDLDPDISGDMGFGIFLVTATALCVFLLIVGMAIIERIF